MNLRGPALVSKTSLLLIIVACLLFLELPAQMPPPQFTKNALLNGMEIFFLPGEGEPARFALLVRNGAAFDPVDKWGVTALMVEMMMERTERRGGEQLRQDLKTLGASLQSRMDWDAIYFYGSAPQHRLEDTLNVLAEIVLRPEFTEESFEQVRSRMKKQIEEDNGQPELLTQQLFQKDLFDQNPYAHDVRGEVATLENLQLNDIKIQYRRLMMPNQAQMALSQSADTSELFRSFGRSWGSWVRGEAAPFTFRQSQPQRSTRVIVLDQPSDEILVRLGSLAVEKNSTDYYALKILEQYLTLSLPEWADQLTAQSQIQASVRFEPRKMPGFFQFNFKAPISQVNAFLSRFLTVIEQLKGGRIDPDRLNEARELAFLELRNAWANPESRLFELLKANLYDLGISYFTAYGLRLQRIDATRFQSALQNTFPPDSFLIVAAGPAAKLAPELKNFGSVQTLN